MEYGLGKNPEELDANKRLSKGLNSSQSAFLEWLTKEPENKQLPRKDKPHVASIDFNIKFRHMDANGQISPEQIPSRDVQAFLTRAGMSNAGSIYITGSNLNETIQKIDKILRLIDEQNKRK